MERSFLWARENVIWRLKEFTIRSEELELVKRQDSSDIDQGFGCFPDWFLGYYWKIKPSFLMTLMDVKKDKHSFRNEVKVCFD